MGLCQKKCFRILRSFLLLSSLTLMLASASAAAATSIAPSAVAAILWDRHRAALLGLFIGDAVAMPVHWMYSLRQLQADYGVIRGYVAPKDRFEGSIMNLSNTGGGGRGSDAGSIVGDVILHGKKKFWVRGGNFHYHLGLRAGENTLEAQLARLLVRTMAASGGRLEPDAFFGAYAKFMTTPGSHTDTYAATAHRMFFANVVKGVPLNDCADNDGHNVDAIDALTLAVPVIVSLSAAGDVPPVEVARQARVVVGLIRRVPDMDAYVNAFAGLLGGVLAGADLRTSVEACGAALWPGRSVRAGVARSGSADPMVACYMEQAFAALLHFAYKYADSPEAAVLANANAGGENVARGSLLGALMGAAHGTARLPAWATEGLLAREAISAEINALLSKKEGEPEGVPASADVAADGSVCPATAAAGGTLSTASL